LFFAKITQLFFFFPYFSAVSNPVGIQHYMFGNTQRRKKKVKKKSD
jgi:hypothetical protein